MLFWNTNKQEKQLSEKCDNLSLPSAEGTLALSIAERCQCSSLGFNASKLVLPELMIAWLSMLCNLVREKRIIFTKKSTTLRAKCLSSHSRWYLFFNLRWFLLVCLVCMGFVWVFVGGGVFWEGRNKGRIQRKKVKSGLRQTWVYLLAVLVPGKMLHRNSVSVSL